MSDWGFEIYAERVSIINAGVKCRVMGRSYLSASWVAERDVRASCPRNGILTPSECFSSHKIEIMPPSRRYRTRALVPSLPIARCQSCFPLCLNISKNAASVVAVLVQSLHSSVFKHMHFDYGANSFPLPKMTGNNDRSLASRLSLFQGNKART